MTMQERMDAARRCLRDPPMCKCGVRSEVVRPQRGDGWPLCDFNEYLQGQPRSKPTEEQLQNFESRKVPWPCDSSPPLTRGERGSSYLNPFPHLKYTTLPFHH
ncbi:hypothetical protein HU200_024919 [Digitaria exilis]|uniref:Uncharacterized protein n=1 Tax=Digitaria exilis TaxID=1010633 RepID=A0A835BZC1_9POAL|nr:hypothetical protein HU200_024919 [Digitaria exilis]